MVQFTAFINERIGTPDVLTVAMDGNLVLVSLLNDD
jgi:hypothetical protein